MPAPQRLRPLVASVDGLLYVIGGYWPLSFGFEATDAVESYDPKTDTWTEMTTLPSPRCCMAGGVLNGRIYVAGGMLPLRSGARLFSDLLVYDPATNSWTHGTPMPQGEPVEASGALGGELYVIGDYSYPAYSYDPATDSWGTAPPDPTQRGSAAAGAADDTIYVVGGLFPYSTALGLNEAFSPFLAVNIDIKPGDPNNVINLKSGGVVPVAILGSATFDPKTVEPSTVTFAGAHVAKRPNGTLMTTVADVNHDGYPDLVLYFRTQDLTALAPAVAAMSLRPAQGRLPSPPRNASEDTGATSPSGTPVGPSLHQNAGLKARATGSPLGTALQQTRDGQTPPLQQVEAVLYGKTYSGTPIRGSGMVELVPPSHPANPPRR